MLPYGTQLLSDVHPRKMSRFSCGNLENTTRSCVSNQEHFSSDSSSSSGIASSIWVKRRVERGNGMRQLLKTSRRSVDGKWVSVS